VTAAIGMTIFLYMLEFHRETQLPYIGGYICLFIGLIESIPMDGFEDPRENTVSLYHTGGLLLELVAV
jgi:hypothetical protein